MWQAILKPDVAAKDALFYLKDCTCAPLSKNNNDKHHTMANKHKKNFFEKQEIMHFPLFAIFLRALQCPEDNTLLLSRNNNQPSTLD